MTTLAQMLIEHGPPADAWGARGAVALALLQARLKGAELGESIQLEPGQRFKNGAELKRKAEQFIFTEDAPTVVRDLITDKAISGDVVWRTARVPTEVCWIEWKPQLNVNGVVETLRIGVLLDGSIDARGKSSKVIGDKRGVCIVAAALDGEMGSEAPAHFASVGRDLVKFEGQPGIDSILHWSMPSPGGVPVQMEEFKTIMQDAMYCLFLITTPRVCEVVDVSHPVKLQKARQKRGKLPLLEYKHMQLKVGQGGTRRARSGGSASSEPSGVHHRLHQVMGHFRTLQKNRETPHVSWVPHHWRGDAELGIVLHTREVTNVKEGASHVAVE